MHSCFRVGVYLYIVSNRRDKNMQTLYALIKDLGNTDLCVFPK